MSDHEIDLVKFGEALKAKRGKASLSDVVEELGFISKSHLSYLERGLRMPDLDLYIRLCRWMSKDVREFIKNWHYVQPTIELPENTDTSKYVDVFRLERRVTELEKLISQHFSGRSE